jgi:diaminohydroxyphosphoribosylaminopyrimidine deaminase/5-amino-6-(5-phosphoribosylamino)uracil reductase
MSLDGRTAMASGESQWITGEDARADVQRLRAESDLMVTGVGTVLADDCRLTLRADELTLDGEDKERALAYPPARMVLDSKGRTPADARILAGGETTVITTENIALGESSQVVVLGADAEGRVDIGAWVKHLGEQSFNEIMVEAGPTLSGALLSGGWVDRLIIYQAPRLLGDDARAMAAMNFLALADTPEFEINEVTRIGADLRIIAGPKG